jgi:hypothetical protein
MSGDYYLNKEVFQKIQKMWRCYLKVDLFTSKKNRLTKTYASVIPRKDPDNIRNTLRLNWSNIKGSILLHPPIPLLLKVLKKFYEEGKIAILIAPSWKGQVRMDLFKNDYSTGEIRKHVNQGEGHDKERTPTVTREFKCILI